MDGAGSDPAPARRRGNGLPHLDRGRNGARQGAGPVSAPAGSNLRAGGLKGAPRESGTGSSRARSGMPGPDVILLTGYIRADGLVRLLLSSAAASGRRRARR